MRFYTNIYYLCTFGLSLYMEQKETSFIEDFRKLEKELGKDKAEAIFQMIAKYNQIQINNLSTKADIEGVRTEFHRELGNVKEEIHRELGNVKEEIHRELGNVKESVQKSISNISWRVAGFLIAQSALIAALLKLFQE